MTKTTLSVIGISETELDESISSNEIKIKAYELLRVDRSQRGREHTTTNLSFYFFDIFLPETKPILAGIL